MRKRIVPLQQAPGSDREGDWLDLGAIAEVEITSEDPKHPIEFALIPGEEGGWRANAPGRQVIRLLFSPAQRITHVQLHFEEKSVARTQEYALSWSPQIGEPCREIVRQQWNYLPESRVRPEPITDLILTHTLDLPIAFRMGVAEDHRPPGADVIDVLFAVF